MAQDQTDLYALLERIKHGDQVALSSLYDLTIGKVFSIVLQVTANTALAEETVNDVYLQVWRTAASYQSERAMPLSWLMMLAHSRAIDALRKEATISKPQVEMPEDDIIEDENLQRPVDKVMAVEQQDLLHAALNLLDKQERQLIELAFYRGMSHQELANYTGEPLGTIKTVLRRAQTKLRARLTESFPERLHS
jgi:RNA polymerase sigma-70 factor (ECF subfamily)